MGVWRQVEEARWRELSVADQKGMMVGIGGWVGLWVGDVDVDVLYISLITRDTLTPSLLSEMCS